METGFFSRRRPEKARLAPIFALAAFAFLGAARMEAGLQEEAIVREEGTFGFSELAARAEGTAETIQEKDGRVSVQLKDVKAAVRKTDPGRESAETESEGKEEKTKEITKEKTKKKESADGQEEWKEYELDRLLVYLPPEEIGKEELLPGMKLLCMGELEIFEPARNAGEFDYRLYYRSRHICCRMSAKKAEITDRSADPLKAAAYSFRERAREALKQFCTEKDAGLLSAVLLGDKTQMDEEINDLYQKNGIAHLLAVSGLHVSLIGMGLYRLLRRLGLGFGWAGVWSGGLLFLYGTMTGFGPSVFRACLMLACSFAASYLGRTYDLLSAMSLAAICLSLENPFVIFTGAFQLSFGAVFAIGWAGKELSDGLECKKEWENALAVSLAIQLVTGPIVLYHFFEYPLYGIFLNFLVIPLMTYVVGAGIAGLLMGMAGISLLAAAAGAGTLSGAAAAVGHLLELGAEGSMGTCHYIFAWYEMLCRLTKRLPGSSLILGRPESWKLAAYYGILAVLLLFLGSRGRKRAETGERTKAGEMMEKDREAAAKDRFMDRIKIWGCLSSLIVFLLYRSVSGLRIDFIDVGQGDGILLETKKQVVLVDGGSTQLKKLGEQRLEPLLKSRGIRKIDMAFVSHGDQDHISGLMWLLEEDTGIEIGRLFLPLPGKGEEIYEKLESAAARKGVKTDYICTGDLIQSGKLSLSCLHPYSDTLSSDRNGHSEVLLAEYGDFSMLLMGDLGTEGEAEIAEVWDEKKQVQILKAGHHGSSTSSSELFLDTVRPQIAVLSYGKDNSYGHPHPEVIERLEERGIASWATEEQGMITVRTDGKELEIQGFLKNR
ncbi:MAG: ComEC/Rec2 family competence protein [Clostridium sp.]|nr:ComEC/Rec2 family competence protein [Clostridium sp.]